jgi:hypothetical protein
VLQPGLHPNAWVLQVYMKLTQITWCLVRCEARENASIVLVIVFLVPLALITCCFGYLLSCCRHSSAIVLLVASKSH